MENVKITPTVKFSGKLGKLQTRITVAVKEAFPRSKSELIPLPNGFAGLYGEWKGFNGHDVAERQRLVRDVADSIDRDVSKLVPMIIALTPDEAAQTDDS